MLCGVPGNVVLKQRALQQSFLGWLKLTEQDLVDLQKTIKHLKETADVGVVFRPFHLAAHTLTCNFSALWLSDAHVTHSAHISVFTLQGRIQKLSHQVIRR